MSEVGEPVPICEYDQKVLHLPVNPQGAVNEVSNMIKQKVTLKLELKDDRHVTGTFTAFDKFGNFVLTSATEFFREEERKMQMMIVPLDFVVKIFSKPADFTKTEKL